VIVSRSGTNQGVSRPSAPSSSVRPSRPGRATLLADLEGNVSHTVRRSVDPQVVVYGGGFSRSADLVLDSLRRELQKLCPRVPDVRASTLGADGVALGALRLALNEVDQRLFSVGLSASVAPRREV